MRIATTFSFCFPVEDQHHHLILDTSAPEHAVLADYIGNRTDADEIKWATGDYLTELVRGGSEVLNARLDGDVIKYDVRLDLAGTVFTASEVIDLEGETPPDQSDLVWFIENEFNETHHYFEVHVDTCTVI